MFNSDVTHALQAGSLPGIRFYRAMLRRARLCA